MISVKNWSPVRTSLKSAVSVERVCFEVEFKAEVTSGELFSGAEPNGPILVAEEAPAAGAAIAAKTRKKTINILENESIGMRNLNADTGDTPKNNSPA
jgi:hypothetical protein